MIIYIYHICVCVVHLPHCFPLGSWLWGHCWVRLVKHLYRWSSYYSLRLSFKCQFFKRIDGILNLISIEFTAPKRKRKRWPGAWWSFISILSFLTEEQVCFVLSRRLASEDQRTRMRSFLWNGRARHRSRVGIQVYSEV